MWSTWNEFQVYALLSKAHLFVTVGASKPSFKIFHAAIDASGVPAERSLYIDDIREYVLAARRIGLNAIQFRSRRQLEADLRARHLL